MALNIAVVTGGFSGEKVIAMKSADVVMKHLDKTKYKAYKIIIEEKRWYASIGELEVDVDKNDFSITVENEKINFDCVFTAIHGTPGEDGKLQGYWDMLGITYTNGNALNSALTFNKGFTNKVLSTYGINSSNSYIAYKGETFTADDILSKVSLPCFIKPNEGGSSIGVTKVKTKEDLLPAIEKALKESDQVIIEDLLIGTEITCGVINYKGTPKAIGITEIVAANEFFDFEAKYNDAKTQEITPARIPADAYEACLRMSERIYKLLNCKGFIRIDYFNTENGLYVVEVNTVPGLSEASILPKQAGVAGIALTELFGNAIEMAV